MDRAAWGLALALAALAAHALATLAGGSPTLDALARAIAFVLLPGWAAARRLHGHEARGGLESAALAVVAGAALAGATRLFAQAIPIPTEGAALMLAVLALASLAPRSGPRAATSAPGNGSLAGALAGAALGVIGLALATSNALAAWVRPLADLQAPAGDADAGARAAGVLCALLLATSGAALVRRWTHSAAAAGAAALLLAAGAGSMIFAARPRPGAPPTASSTAADPVTRP
jgi:hypothetical protein